VFDPDRLQETHVPGGWMPPDAKLLRIQGHEFGLELKENERRRLIAFFGHCRIRGAASIYPAWSHVSVDANSY